MMANTGATGQKYRGLNIAKGIVAQEVLRRELGKRGVDAATQRKSHRADDLFDFSIKTRKGTILLDFKTFHHYTDYGLEGIESLTKKLIIDNANYAGPDWRRFFPMLIAHTQILQDKEYYCFAMASSIDPRHDVGDGRSGHAITAFPYGEHMPFLCSKKLCLAREDAAKGFSLRIRYCGDGLMDRGIFPLTVIGEWGGKMRVETLKLKGTGETQKIGPFSCICSFQVDSAIYDNMYGQIQVAVASNEYRAPILNAAKRNQNVPPGETMIITRDAFCNLMLPDNYAIYCLGWIPKADYLQAVRKYPGWVWPLDRTNKYMNQPWSQITERDSATIERAGFGDCISRKPSMVNAGWMKTSGHGAGACCYAFPNTGHGGGIKETNLYVLPQDLFVMDDITKL